MHMHMHIIFDSAPNLQIRSKRAYMHHIAVNIYNKKQNVYQLYINTFKYIPIYEYITRLSFFFNLYTLALAASLVVLDRYLLPDICTIILLCVLCMSSAAACARASHYSYRFWSCRWIAAFVYIYTIYIQYYNSTQHTTHCCLCNSSVSYYTYIYVYM